jgi:uncharacterized protein with HEPN domain
MTTAARKYLEDILRAAEETGEFLKDTPDFSSYSGNLVLRRAVERELEIIGEAMNKLLVECPDLDIPDSRKIIAMRHRIIHGYAGIDNRVVWQAAVQAVPALKVIILGLLKRT